MGASLSNTSFKDQKVWVVGASSGIGQALAEELHKCGATVVVSARRADSLNSLVEKLNGIKTNSAHALAMDATDLEQAEAFTSQASELLGGRIDVVVLCHGISNRGSVEKTDLSVEKRLFDVNFFSYVAIAKAVLPRFLQQKRGKFVVMSSVQGFFGLPHRAPYAASKHALHGYFESLRAEVAHRGVSVNIICPGYVRTELSMHALTTDASSTNNRMDETTASGYAPEYFAQRALVGVLKNKDYTVVAQTSARVAIFLKRFFPGILAKILKGKGKKLEA